MLHVVLVHNVSGRGKRHGTSEDPGGLQNLLVGWRRSVTVRVFVSVVQSVERTEQQSKWPSSENICLTDWKDLLTYEGVFNSCFPLFCVKNKRGKMQKFILIFP